MDVNNENPYTILVRAIQNMDMKLARMLIVDNDVLPRAACEKDLKLLIRNAALLNDGPLLRQIFRHNSILGGEVLVSMMHNSEVAKTLVMAGAELCFRDVSSAATPLHILLASDYPRKFELAELMYDRGAVCDNAYGYGRHSAVGCAIKAGAPEDFLRKIVRNWNDDFTRCAVAISESNERQDLMLLLVTGRYEEGVARSRQARTAILHLLESATCNTEVVRALLEYDLPVDTTDQNGHTALHRAIQRANSEVAELYLQRGADPNRKSWWGILPLWIASSLEDSSMAIALIRHGADVHDHNTNGQRPIHGACKGHSLSNMLLLIRLGVDINVVSEKGETPLSLLAEKDSPNKGALYAFVIRQLALVASGGVNINDHDMHAIQKPDRMQYFDLCFQELQRMQRMEVDEGILYYTFLIGNVNRTSSYVRRDDFTDIFENEARLKALFPCYFCDLRNAYVFAKERESLLIAKEQFLNEIFSEVYQVPLPDLVVNKIANYLCFDVLNNFMLDFHSRTFSSMIWE